MVFTTIDGYFTETQAQRIRDRTHGKTYMNFNVTYSNHAGNCIINISTDYDTTPEDLKSFFVFCALNEL